VDVPKELSAKELGSLEVGTYPTNEDSQTIPHVN